MELYGHVSKSIPQKAIIHILETGLLWLSFWILFQGGGNWVEEKFNIANAGGGGSRRIIIFVFNLVTFLRLAYMMFFLLKRKIPWEESVSVPFAFAIYFVGFALFVLPVNAPLDGFDIFGILLFAGGSVLNTRSEILRNKWKKDAANAGKIYTEGLFRYSRHINYFGDILWVTGYAIVTRNLYALSIPLLIFCFFAFYNAPALDKYLKSKYGSGYDAYAEKAKMLIPFIW